MRTAGLEPAAVMGPAIRLERIAARRSDCGTRPPHPALSPAYRGEGNAEDPRWIDASSSNHSAAATAQRCGESGAGECREGSGFRDGGEGGAGYGRTLAEE